MMAGTFGYMTPEMPHTDKASKESDVDSFGALMLEVMCGSRALEASAIERGEGILVDRVWRAFEEGNILGVADLRLEFRAFPPCDTKNLDACGEFELQKAAGFLITDEIDPSATPAPDAVMDHKKLKANLLHLGLLCCNPNPDDRPSMRLVSQVLQSSEDLEISLPPLPDCKSWSRFSRAGFPKAPVGMSWSSRRIGYSEVSAAMPSWSSWRRPVAPMPINLRKKHPNRLVIPTLVFHLGSRPTICRRPLLVQNLQSFQVVELKLMMFVELKGIFDAVTVVKSELEFNMNLYELEHCCSKLPSSYLRHVLCRRRG